MSTFYLGQRVTFTFILRRRGTWDKVWERERADGYWDDRIDPVAQDGIVIGLRTLSDGACVDLGPDQGVGYQYAKPVPAVVIATHLRRKPVFAPPDAVKATDAPAK